MMHDSLQMILLKRFEVKVSYFHDNLKSYEMNDAMLNSVLIGEHVNANTFTKESTLNLAET